jgi:CheY-like chemotaxis protein/DNA-binding XRE family transcriptional regulator
MVQTDQQPIPTSEKIQKIRRHRGYSQEELARQLGVSFPTVNSWERGKSQPYPRHQKSIDDLYRDVVAEYENHTVLVVEDDPSTGMVIADYVEMALPDWKAMVIDNGYDAILQIGLVKPKLVLLDIMMPEIDGFKVFERLSEMDELKSTRVIFVTAATDDAVLDRARNSGAFALIQKPLNREILTETLQRAAAESVST